MHKQHLLFAMILVSAIFAVASCGGDEGGESGDPCASLNPPPGCAQNTNNDDDMGSNNCTPTAEVCDGEDNDCDGEVDEDFALGESCEAGSGACLNTGETVCNDSGDDVTCSATAGDPSSDEICDGNDNDCDGEVDEGFDTLGDECTVGVGACEATGTFACADDGMDVECDAVEGTPAEMDLCDGIDNDCNGTVDDDFVDDLGTSCMVGVGACVNMGTNVCAEDGMSVTCDAMPSMAPEATEMTCDDIDNDCDGEVDEGCDDDMDDYCDETMTTVGTPAACPNGGGDCNDDQEVAFPGGTEVCDTFDNDCDGLKDNDANDATTYFLDCDGDGFAATSTGSRVSCSPPATTAADTACNTTGAAWTTTLPSSQSNTDCEDTLSDVAPDQTTYFDTPYTASNGTSSFDYNCDSMESKQWINSSVATNESCSPPNACVVPVFLDCGLAGWSATLPRGCGASGTYSFCSTRACNSSMFSLTECTGNRTVETRTQACR